MVLYFAFDAAFVLAPLALLFLLALWTRWLRRRARAPRAFVVTAYGLILAGALSTLVGLVLGLWFMRIFVVDTGGADEQRRIVAEGVSAALNFGFVGWVLSLIVALVLLFGTWRWRGSEKPDARFAQ